MLNELLLALTGTINLIGLIVSLWLGFFIVTRSPRSRVSWLAGATLWSLAGYFMNGLTHIRGSPGEIALPWWWGWSVALAVPFWFHLSVSLLPSELARRRRPLVIVVYLITLNLVAMEAYTPWIFAGATTQSPIYSSAQRPGMLFPLFGFFLVAVPTLAFHNFYVSRRRATSPPIQQQFTTLLWATALAIFSALYTSLSIGFGLDTPALASSLGLGAGVALLGYGVARYNALIEGRAIRLDFIYTSLVAGLVVGVYLLGALVSDLIIDVPFVAFIFIIMLAVITHSLYDWARLPGSVFLPPALS